MKERDELQGTKAHAKGGTRDVYINVTWMSRQECHSVVYREDLVPLHLGIVPSASSVIARGSETPDLRPGSIHMMRFSLWNRGSTARLILPVTELLPTRCELDEYISPSTFDYS